MNRVVSMILVDGAVGGVVVRRVLQSSRGSTDEEANRHAVTINCPPEEVAGDTVEVEIR